MPARKPTYSDVGQAARRTEHRLYEAQYGAPGPINQTRPVTDPQNQTAASMLSLDRTARIVYGLITDSTAIGNAYRVQLEFAKQPVVAFYGARTTIGSFGPRELTTLQPGTLVTCVMHEHLPYAQIIAAVPPPGISAKASMSTIIHGASRNRVDKAHKAPMQMVAGGKIPAFLSGRPFDATTGGEAGWIAETGAKLFVDPFMVLAGIEESCQISFFYHDMLARLAGYQLQIWSSSRELESINDQEESQDWTGYVQYPWEAFGLTTRTDPSTINSAETWQQDEPYYSKMEPSHDYAAPWHREREFHGYLGQGFKRTVVGQPHDSDSVSFEGGPAGDVKSPGLADISIGLDGRIAIQSAKGISLSKRAIIVAPTRKRVPQDPNGDTPDNYKFSGQEGSGPEHKITGDIKAEGDNTTMQRAMGVMDLHAYLFNYSGLHPFFYHEKDYLIYEESEASWAGGKYAEVPDFSQLASESYLDAADYKQTWKIDDRYGEQQFYTLSCGFNMGEDGSINISDGFGGCIRMAGGAVEISAPGNVWLRSGRNVVAWAGYDLVLRAKHSWDITATEFDGRLKAEKNLMVLGGNGGEGGVLVESRGDGPKYDFEECGEDVKFNGIALKSKKAAIVAWSKEIYLRTGGGDIEAGPLTIDADRGKGILATYADQTHNYLKTGVYWHLKTSDEEVEGPSAMITKDLVLLTAQTCIDGDVKVNGHGIFKGNVMATDTIFAKTNPFVIGLTGDALSAIESAIENCKELMYETIPKEVGQKVMDSVLVPSFYDQERPGDDDVITKAEFSLRIQDNYKTEKFKLYEDFWQQLGRITGKASATWEEKAVLCKGDETYPYPGKEAFDDGSNYIQQDFKIYSPEEGRSKSRGSQPDLSDEYADPKYGEPDKKSLNDYLIVE